MKYKIKISDSFFFIISKKILNIQSFFVCAYTNTYAYI